MELCDAPSVVVLRDKLLYHLVCEMVRLPENATVGERIRYHRRKVGLYTYDLAELAGISRYAVMDYENGTSEPPLELLNIIAAVCGVETDNRALASSSPTLIFSRHSRSSLAVSGFGNEP